jgi:hypothetical protein
VRLCGETTKIVMHANGANFSRKIPTV